MHYLVLLGLFIGTLLANPLSQINIVSKKASLTKSDENQDLYIKYRDDVKVTLSDQSTIQSDNLNIILDNAQTETKTSNELKKIIFHGNITMRQKNRTIQSEVAEIFPYEKQCQLLGHVRVEQKKKSSSDISMVTQSSTANLNLDTHEVEFIGDRNSPVETILNLEDHPSIKKLQPKKKNDKNTHLS